MKSQDLVRNEIQKRQKTKDAKSKRELSKIWNSLNVIDGNADGF